MRHKNPLFLLLVALTLNACQKDPQETLFTKIPPEESGLTFVNKIENEEKFNIFSYRNFYNGGGVAIGDINNDGLADIYLTANMGPNRLYLNKGNFQFEDISAFSGTESEEFWSTGVSMVDINNDGLLDIYVCNAGFKKGQGEPKNQLYINQGNNTFIERAADYGLDDSGYTTHAVFFDYDGDGLLDCYILNNSFIPVNTLNYSNKRSLRAEDWPVKDYLKGGGDKLLRNTGERFVEVSEEAGIYGSLIGFGLGVTVGDLNNDGWPDIYVSNDFFERDYLYLNQQNGTFVEVLTDRMGHISLSSMGADMGDINNDGWADIFVTDMLPYEDYRLKTTTDFEKYDVHQLKLKKGFFHQFAHNTLQLNTGQASFQQIAFQAGVAATDWSWGALMLDADGDGWQDLLVCNGIYHDVIDQDFIDFFANDIIQKMVMSGKKEEVNEIIKKMPSTPIQNFLFKNQGNLRFQDKAKEWGLGDLTYSNGAAYGDLDGDGDLDLVINNVNQKVLLYKNNSQKSSSHRFLGLQLKGSQFNPFAIGSKILVYHKGQKQMRELIPNRGFQSSMDLKIVFGLGNWEKVDSVVIIWPDRSKSSLEPEMLNQYHTLSYEEMERTPLPNPLKPLSNPYFQEEALAFLPHEEDKYVDFDFERNLPMLLSQEGPPIALADLNGDGLEDVILGGARGFPTQVWLGQAHQTYIKVEAGQLTQFAEFEDTCISIFDANGDGLPDVFIGSGGNFQVSNTREMQDRLYLNQGNLQFELKTNAFPPNGMNSSVSIPFDFDKDGILDLFVGSRSQPMQYGLTPRSYVYINDGTGKFMDKTETIAPELAQLGMICDATMAPLLEQGKMDLIVVGEWMEPTLFRYDGRLWNPQTIEAFKNKKGWWYSVKAEDVTGNGKIDLFLGNRGTNGYLGSKEDLPIKMYLQDFNDNGSIDKVLAKTIQGREVPVMMKRDLTLSLPSLKKENLTHHQFASKSMLEIFGKERLGKSKVREVNTFETLLLLNEGEGHFINQTLPIEVQFSSVNTIASLDVNQDGLPDLILAGNQMGYPPQFSQLDANPGMVLINQGQGNFQILNPTHSGILLKGQVRSLVSFERAGKKYLLAGINNEAYRLFSLVNHHQK
jgi:enediyne biosynthesis protein E4